MTRSRLLAAAVAASSLLPSARASAQEQPGYASNHFNPSERGSRWFVLDSLEIKGNGRLALGLVNDYSNRSLDEDGPGASGGPVVRNQYLAHLGAAMVVGDRFRIGASVPLQLYADGHVGWAKGQ